MVCNWLSGEFTRLLNLTDSEPDRVKVGPRHLGEMLDLMDEGKLSGAAAKMVFEEMFNTGKHAAEIISEKGLGQISDTGNLERIVDKVIADNPQAVADYRKGKEKALTFLTGQVMKQIRGRANAEQVQSLLKEKLK
jgi:aspartyl-tRNA(Asn)/glutamyl-tRNA(Gln) amidotransferase subunit B